MRNLLKAVALVALAFFTSGAFAQGALLFQPQQLSTAQEKSLLSADEQTKLASGRNRVFAKNTSVVSLDRNAFYSAVIRVPLPSGAVLSFLKTSDETTKDGTYLWQGKTAERNGDLTVAISSDGTVLGVVNNDGVRTSITSLSKGSKYQMMMRPTTPLPPMHAASEAQGVKK